MSPREGDLAAAAIAAYAPASLSPEAGAFARAAVARAAPRRRERAKALLYAAGRLAAFGESVGLEPSAQALLREATIERFVLTGCAALSAATRRTLRTNLRALARAHEAIRRPEPVALPRERAKPPYSEAEINGYLRLAAAQATEARRMRATALLCLGAGAGIVGAELRQLRGREVLRRSGGLTVVVSGRRARVVPVLVRFHEPLAEAARFAGRGYLLGGESSERRNLSDAPPS
jgi:integrase